MLVLEVKIRCKYVDWLGDICEYGDEQELK
jgi:hypothetical protein